MSVPRIIGIVLVRNEDHFVRNAVENIIDFCDEILLCDNGSTDATASILKELSATHPGVSLHALKHPSESHDLLKPFIGTRTWVFGVDGDEIYDSERLRAFRIRLLSGEFEGIWRMKGNVLHCTSLSADHSSATGYMAPPSRSITKLYNFNCISSWEGDTVERLHGGNIRFKNGFDDSLKLNFQESLGWGETPLRCLHACFLKRSSLDQEEGSMRENIMEIYRGGVSAAIRRFLGRITGRRLPSRWKQNLYRQGPLETIDARVFFS